MDKPDEGTRTTTVTISLTPEGMINMADEALLDALTERGFKYSELRRGENQITYLVWDPATPE